MANEILLTKETNELLEWCQENVTTFLPVFVSNEEAQAYLSQLATAFNEFRQLAIDEDTDTLIERQLPELNDLTPLQYASSYGYTQFLKNMRQDVLARDISPIDRNLLHFAAANASLASTRFLLEQGFSPATPDKDGNRPFHLALKFSAFEDRSIFTDIRTGIFSALCEKLVKSELEACNNEGENIVHMMATYGVSPMLDTLIQQNSSLLAAQTETDKQTPLHRAILNNHDDIALKLIHNKQGVNTPDARRNTPLHLAYEADNQNLVAELIKHGADTNAINSHGKTPQQVGDDLKKSESVGIMR